MVCNLRKCFSKITVIPGGDDLIISVYKQDLRDLVIIHCFQIFIVDRPLLDICCHISKHISVIIFHLLDHREKTVAFMDQGFHNNRERILSLLFFQFLNLFFLKALLVYRKFL